MFPRTLSAKEFPSLHSPEASHDLPSEICLQMPRLGKVKTTLAVSPGPPHHSAPKRESESSSMSPEDSNLVQEEKGGFWEKICQGRGGTS